MADPAEIALKFKMLWLYGFRNFSDWRRDVWLQDGTSHICCSGHECGCYGADYFSQWEYFWRTRKSRRAQLKGEV